MNLREIYGMRPGETPADFTDRIMRDAVDTVTIGLLGAALIILGMCL